MPDLLETIHTDKCEPFKSRSTPPAGQRSTLPKSQSFWLKYILPQITSYCALTGPGYRLHEATHPGANKKVI